MKQNVFFLLSSSYLFYKFYTTETVDSTVQFSSKTGCRHRRKPMCAPPTPRTSCPNHFHHYHYSY